jgi:hypothetical protein
MLLTRAWPFRELLDEFDSYERDRHFPDLMRAPGAAFAQYFEAVVDSLPQAYQGSGNRLAVYSSRTLDELFEWLRSSAFAEAIKDGGETWFGRMNELDRDLYTGNVYEVRHVLAAGNGRPRPDAALFVERFEIESADADGFDSWALQHHLEEIAGADGVIRVRYCGAIREGIPLPYYVSPGNRMVMVELASEKSLRSTLLSDGLRTALADSLQWDVRLSYVRRDVYSFRFTARADPPEGEG